MKLTTCSNGHYYDSDTYASCPYCGGGSAGANETVAFQHTQSSPGATLDIGSYAAANSGQAVQPETNLGGGFNLDDSKTVSIYQNIKAESVQLEPTTGWLVCIKGKFFGQDFRLKSGRNFIGRGSNMDVCLAGENTVSRDRHAAVIHEPRKNIFIAQPGESRELFYVNGNVVLSSVQLKKNDVIQVGDVQLMLIPCCDEAFNWSEKED